MNQITEKVIQRFAYEGLLLSNILLPRKMRITLQDALEASKEEPRVLEALPAVLLHKPGIFLGLDRDLKKNPKMHDLIQKLRSGKKPNLTFLGVPPKDYMKTAQHFRRCLSEKKTLQKSLVLNLRISQEEMRNLQKLNERKGGIGLSETIRSLIQEKTADLAPNP